MKLDLRPYDKALIALRRALERARAAPEDAQLRDACIQHFGLTLELAWKSLKRRQEMDLPDAQAVDAMSYRALIRVGA